MLPEETRRPADHLGGTTTTTATTTTRTAPATTTTIVDRAISPNASSARSKVRAPGQAADRRRCVNSDRRALEIKVGDVVATSGSCASLAPAEPRGRHRVSKVDDRPGSAGPLIEVEPAADLDKLNFVVVVLYLPATEVPGETCD